MDGRVETTMVDDDGSIGANAGSATSGAHSSINSGTGTSHSAMSASSSSSNSDDARASASSMSSSTVNGVTRTVRVTRDETGCTVTIDERDNQE